MVLLPRSGFTLTSCLTLFLSLATATYATPPKNAFIPSEHIATGDRIKLYFTTDDSGKVGYKFHHTNGLVVSYGDMISFGDFYQIPGQPISTTDDPTEQRARFIASFNSFAENTAVVTEATQILHVIHDEKNAIEEAIKNGEQPEDAYQRIGKDSNRQYNCITGGGCSPSSWWLDPGRYLILAKENYDHFGAAAWIAYQTGHQLAIETAIQAHATHDKKQLERAYALNAFASHFLTDRFSAGHIRTPRNELKAHTTPATAGDLLANYMHNEEGVNGLHVHNKQGKHWIAYGDGSFYSEKNKDNRQLLELLLQISVDEVFTAYQEGVAAISQVPDFLPEADEIGNASNLDISPLFYWDDAKQQLMRRKDLDDVYDRNWTSHWWGWSTLASLAKKRGIPHFTQGQLVASGLQQEAINADIAIR